MDIAIFVGDFLIGIVAIAVLVGLGVFLMLILGIGFSWGRASSGDGDKNSTPISKEGPEGGGVEIDDENEKHGNEKEKHGNEKEKLGCRKVAVRVLYILLGAVIVLLIIRFR